MWLDKCLKSPVSEDPSTSNMVNGPKHCWNLSDSTFTIVIDPSKDNSGWKSFSDWCAKSKDFLLTHWLPTTSILFLTEAIYYNIFRCNYLRIKISFPIFSSFSKLKFNFEHFQKKYHPHSLCIFELTLC